MRMPQLSFTAVLFAAGLSQAAAQPFQPVALTQSPLSGRQLEQSFVGHTLSGVNANRQWYEEDFLPGGTVQGRSVSSQDFTTRLFDTGRWEIIGNSMCITWNNWKDGRQNCFGVIYDPGARSYRYAANGTPFTLR